MQIESPLSTEHPNAAFLNKALDEASLNALRLALYQATQRQELAAMSVVDEPVWGGSLFAKVLAPQCIADLKAISLSLLSSGSIAARPLHSPSEIRRMMGMFVGRPLSDTEFQFGLEQLAFEAFPRSVEWEQPASPPETRSQFHVCVVGAGIGGIAAAIHLQRLGIPFTVIERNPGVGGTWWVNNYPDARVDVPSHLYQYSFEKNYPWKHYYATRDELTRYVEHVSRKHGVHDKIRFGTELLAAKWDEGSCRWLLSLRGPTGQQTLATNALISAAGLFNAPNLPDIPGIETFRGAIFHTTQWDHGYCYAGKRVGLIGNGSSGSQLLRRVAEEAAHVAVFQRSPSWVTPIPGYRDGISTETQWLFDHVPYYWNWYCFGIHWMATSDVDGLHTYEPEWQQSGGLISRRNDALRRFLHGYIVEKVGHDPQLLDKCIPHYPPWTKRLVVDNGWYDALNRDNVDLVTEGIESITPQGVRTRDGLQHELDLLVLGSGFKTERYLWPTRYEGRGGLTLESAWQQDGARAHLGMTVPGFPNLFILYGPNAQPRGGGLIAWLELWARYAVKGIATLIENGHRSMDVRADVLSDYNTRLDQRMSTCIWHHHGTKSYFVN
ncbi:MAG: NAD(P)/FAD-dependent oxidoreductase, partial [Steroidobacteraceae bacterium]